MTNFAFPVCHRNTTLVTRGARPFFQPIVTAPANSVPGMEIYLPASDPGWRLFACFDCKLSWKPASGSIPNRLELVIDPTATPALGQLNSVESRPARIIYENVERNGARAALTSVLISAYRAAVGQPSTKWHPAMRQFNQKKGQVKSRVKERFDAEGEGVAVVMVDELLNGTDVGDLRFRAGDHIGNADVRSPLPGDVNVQRGVVFYTVDAGNQLINPLHYLHLYINAKSPAVTVDENLTNHPLFAAGAFPELLSSTRPAARIPIPVGGVNEDDFALGPMKDPHQAPRGLIKWFYNGDRKIEVQGEGVLTPEASDVTIVTRVWNDAGVDVSDVCSKLQVPCEVAVAVVASESGGDPKAYRFEPMERASIARVTTQTELLLKYDKVLGTKVTGYTATRLPPAATFKAPVVTRLELDVAEAVQLTSFGKIANSRSRSVFLVDDVWRPVLAGYRTTSSRQTHHSIDVIEEQFLSSHSSGGTSPTTVRRAGKIRVLRASVEPIPKKTRVDITVTLTVPSGESLTLTIPKGRLAEAVLDGDLDVDAGAVVTVAVQPPDLGAKLSVEWALGFKDPDPATPPNCWLIPDGNGTQSSAFSRIPEQPFDPSVLVRKDRPAGLENLTWGDVATLIDLTADNSNPKNKKPGGSFLSPGYTQTLVSSAYSAVRSSEGLGTREALGIPPVAKASDLITTGWLLQRRNALYAGIALLRVHYNQLGTQFDLPYVHGWFFGGGPLGEGVTDPTRWGVNTPTPKYLDLIGRRYNAIVELFNGLPATHPTVRFQR